MNHRNVLFVLDDFYNKDFSEGDIITRFEGKYKVLDMNYRNQYGEFILCKYLDDGKSKNWKIETGVLPNSNNPFEIVGVIHAPGYRNLLGGMGYYVKNKRINEIKGYSYREAWSLIFKDGATNAKASKSSNAPFHTWLIDTIDELPSLDSEFWEIPAFSNRGEPFATLTMQASKELNKGIKYAIRNLVKDSVSQFNINTDIDPVKINLVKDSILKANKIAVLTGAGISTMSGIPDFRTRAAGMWMKNPSVLNDLNEQSFQKDSVHFWTILHQLLTTTLEPIMPFHNHQSLIAAMEGIEPNKGHRFFRWLEKDLKKDVTIITQNVDGLHSKAGSKQVIEFHGNLHTCTCPNCHSSYPLTKVLMESEAPVCICGSVLRPDVVFFDDQVRGMEDVIESIEKADLIIVAGTTLEVYQFNRLMEFRQPHSKIVYINAEPAKEDFFDIEINGNISTICWELEQELKEQE